MDWESKVQEKSLSGATEMARALSYGLLENGLDFIWSALEQLSGRTDERKLKYAILHLSSGVELILKERLRREHWSLVFDKPENANRNKYEAGDFSSVSFQGCLKRLVEICAVSITEEQRKRLTTLRDKRNRFEHFGIVDTYEAVTADAAGSLSFVIDFIDSQLAVELTSVESGLVDRIRRKLSVFEAFVRERMLSLGAVLAEAKSPVKHCPRCEQLALLLGDPVRCSFCHYNGTAESVAKEYIVEILDETEEWPLYICPTCERCALVDEGYRADNEYVCFACGRHWGQNDLELCPLCSRLFESSEGKCRSCDVGHQLADRA